MQITREKILAEGFSENTWKKVLYFKKVFMTPMNDQEITITQSEPKISNGKNKIYLKEIYPFYKDRPIANSSWAKRERAVCSE